MEAIGTTPTYWDAASLQEKHTLKAAAKGFESLFVHMMLSEARKGMPEGFLGSSSASKMFYDMFDMQIAQEIASSDALSLGAYIEKAVSSYETAAEEPQIDTHPVKG